jgi:signal transduction histidine kinase
MMRSLLAPLVIGLVLSLALLFGVQWSIVHAALDAVMQDYMASELVQDADELFSAISVQPGGELALTVAHFDPIYLLPSSGRYFQIQTQEAVFLRSPSLGTRSLNATSLPSGQNYVHPVDGPNQQSLLLSATGYELQGHRLTISVAADMNPIRAAFARLMTHYAKVSLIMFALLVALQIGLVRWALAPLRRVQADVGRLERGEISQLREQVPTEVRPLVREVNRLLDLLNKRLQHSRESLGNLAHALKGPLTILMHMAEDEQVREHPKLGRPMAEQLSLLDSRIDGELRRARVAGGRVAGSHVDLATELKLLSDTMLKLHRHRPIDIACRVDAGIPFYGDREDLLELCGNLLDNACKWARSRVVVSAMNSNGLLLVVADDGPGCSPEGLRQIAQRGVRLDESTHGYGLGLSIASGIASSYGASIRFGRSQELGGFEVTVSFVIVL